MNLFYLSHKGDKNLVLTGKAVRARRIYREEAWRGFDIAPADEPQIRVRRATAWYPFRDRPETIGWRAAALGGSPVISLSFTAEGSDEICGKREIKLGPCLEPVPLPWSLGVERGSGDVDLLIHVPPTSNGPVFFATCHELDRRQVLALCKGRGIEIGPGPKPQVLSAPDVEVSYVEQMPPADWNRLYNSGGAFEFDERLWERYVVGEAHDLPVDDASLDFIFSSHVFEHLANPLGHLEIWSKKLRTGGKIVAVIPDFIGSKDYGADPSELRELLEEYERGEFSPSRDHYTHFARLRGMRDGGAKIWDEKFSIHVHFYTYSNMARLMEEAIRRGWFQVFSIMHSQNHKDFYVTAVR